jgi:hypothetical protein
MSKYEDTRIVTFKEDFSKKLENGEVRVFYKKGTTHAIHHKLVTNFESRGAKMDVKKLDLEKVRAERKKALVAAQKRQVEAAYTV